MSYIESWTDLFSSRLVWGKLSAIRMISSAKQRCFTFSPSMLIPAKSQFIYVNLLSKTATKSLDESVSPIWPVVSVVNMVFASTNTSSNDLLYSTHSSITILVARIWSFVPCPERNTAVFWKVFVSRLQAGMHDYGWLRYSNVKGLFPLQCIC